MTKKPTQGTKTIKSSESEKNIECETCSDPAYAREIVEPKISKYVRYFVLLILGLSIFSLIIQLFLGIEDGIRLAELLETRIYFFFFIGMTLVYMALPKLVQEKMGFAADPRLIVVITLFIFAGSFLGQAFSFFDRFAWWDIMLHAISGVILGLLAFALTSALNDSERTKVTLNPFYVALFSFTFAVAVGALWEIAEYAMDWIFKTTMQCWNEDPSSFITGRDYQGAAIIDTMEDLIVDTVGALVVSVIGYFYLVRGKTFMAAKKIHNCLENPEEKK